MTQLPLHSKTGTTNWVVFLLGAVFFGFLGCKLAIDSLQSADTFGYILAGVSILFALFCLLAPRLYYQIVVHHDRIEFTQFGGLRKRTVWRQDLISYEIIIVKYKQASWKLLKLYTIDDHYTIDSQVYANFWELENVLTTGLTPKHPATK